MMQRSKLLLLGVPLTCLLVLSALLINTQMHGVRASGEAVSVWLTTPDGANKLTPQSSLTFGSDTSGSTITVDDTQTFQQMVGFGASMTDSSTWLIETKMSSDQRNALMTQLFDPNNGIGIDFVRIPMGASDFSVNGPYSYDDLPDGQTDPSLNNFSISHDTAYIIPSLQQALQLNSKLTFMANPWSPPAWMKTNNSLLGDGDGTLRSEDYDPLAQYFVKFIQAYQAQGIPISFVTPQNEPSVARDYPGMLLQPGDENNFIKNNLGPALSSAGLSTQILGYDQTWDTPDYPISLLNDPTTGSYLAGIAWHCYAGDPAEMTTIHNQFPSKDAYETECSTGVGSDGTSAAPMSTIDLLMHSTQNWAKTVELWNIALDPSGGPHHGGCGDCVGIVTIDQSTGNVTYNDDFYQLGHFSKFVLPGAYHISSNDVDKVEESAFKNPDGSDVLVAHNSDSSDDTFTVSWHGESFTYTLPAGATVTFQWSGSTASAPTPTPSSTPTSGTLVTAINAGGGATGSFVADTDVDQGNQYSDTSTAINTSGVTNPAPQAVYQTCRWNSSFTYTIPNLTPGASYKIRLHWAELTFQSTGARTFNVAINGTSVLNNFDVYATAGYKHALIKEFTVTANSNSQLVITFTQGGADNPFINGIEILTA